MNKKEGRILKHDRSGKKRATWKNSETCEEKGHREGDGGKTKAEEEPTFKVKYQKRMA